MHFTREQRDAWIENTRESPFNRWLRNRVTDPSGGLNLERLRAVAAEYGIDAAAYAHLNLGQQRMNVGNKLRKVVPPHVYLDDRVASAPGTAAVPLPGTALSAHSTVPAATALPPNANDRDLMRLYGAIVDELRARKVIRTGNAPLGDYAEHLFAKAFGWELASNSAAGHDAIDRAQLRFQIKARRLRSNTPGERQLSVIRALPEGKFDMLAALLFDGDFGIFKAALVPHAVVLKRAVYAGHVNGWRLMLDDTVWNEPGVRDVTQAIAAAAQP